MTDNVENLTHEMRRRMHGKLDEIQTEMRLRFTGVEAGLTAIEQHLWRSIHRRRSSECTACVIRWRSS